MAIQIDDVYKGTAVRDSRELKRDLVMIVRGVPVTNDAVVDATAAKSAVYDWVDSYWAETETGISIPLIGLDVDDQGGGIYTAVAHYSTANFTTFSPTNGQQEFGFEIGSTTERIYQSFGTKSFPVSGETAPDFKGAINVQKSGGHTHVEGCDKEKTTSEFTVIWYFPTSAINDAFVQNLEAICNHVNVAAFRGRAAGSVRFRGATGYAKTGSTVTPVTFRFAVVPNNTTGKTLGPITGVVYTGWQYIWVFYVEQVDTTANEIVSVPKAAYVETIYDPADFSALGIGI